MNTQSNILKNKYILIAIILTSLSGFIGIPRQVQAISGACSSHGGVNCNAGRQSDGSVYCNDNWTGSIAQYDYMVMCNNSNSLDPECVRTVTAYIRDKDVQLNEIEQLINKYIAEATTKMDMSDPINQTKSKDYLNYLYTRRDITIKRYNGYIITSCTGYKSKPIITPTPLLNSVMCNGKSWNNCPAGQRFFCPAIGNAQCIIDTVEIPIITPTPAAPTPSPVRIAPTQKATQSPKPVIINGPTVSVPVTNVNNSSKSAESVSKHKGVVSRMWSWFTGLLGR